MNDIKILNAKGFLKDGGSIKEIYTNIGFFRLVRKLKGNNNGFFGEKGKVNLALSIRLQSALDAYLSKNLNK